MVRKLLFATALAVLGSAAGLAAVAAADRPIRQEIPPTDFVFEPSQACVDFAVGVHEIGEEFELTFSDGRTLFAGPRRLELTNLETGKTITVNISGPISVSSSGTLWTYRGGSLLRLVGGGETGLLLVQGVVVLDRATNEPPMIKAGHVTDLCALLADP
jgi:hypothetical protein